MWTIRYGYMDGGLILGNFLTLTMFLGSKGMSGFNLNYALSIQQVCLVSNFFIFSSRWQHQNMHIS